MNRGRLVVAAAGLLLCAACGANDTTDSEGTAVQEPVDRENTFRVAYREFGPFETAINREWESFREQSGCSLELDAVALDHEPLHAALFQNGGLADGHWDVALVNTDWLAEAHQSGAVLDLSTLIKKRPPENYPDDWTESLWRLQRFGDKVIGLPYHNGPECLIYRRDVFEDETLRDVHYARFARPLAVPETWEEFARLAEFLSRPEDRLYGTVFAAYPDGHNSVYDICLQLWTRGGELFDAQGKMRLNSPEMIRALTFYRKTLNNPFAVHPKCRQFDSVESGEAFLRGEVVMMVNWFGFAAVCETSDESKVKGRVAVAPVPRGKDGSAASLNCYWLLSVASGSPHADTAYDFARHCTSRANDKRRSLEGVIGCRKSTWADEEVRKAVPFYTELETLHAVARELPRRTNWVELSEEIDRMAVAAVGSDRPIEAIVREAQQRVDKLQ